jgi:hypothetical protein
VLNAEDGRAVASLWDLETGEEMQRFVAAPARARRAAPGGEAERPSDDRLN